LSPPTPPFLPGKLLVSNSLQASNSNISAAINSCSGYSGRLHALATSAALPQALAGTSRRRSYWQIFQSDSRVCAPRLLFTVSQQKYEHLHFKWVNCHGALFRFRS
jgi:hypothetical protein